VTLYFRCETEVILVLVKQRSDLISSPERNTWPNFLMTITSFFCETGKWSYFVVKQATDLFFPPVKHAGGLIFF